MLLFKACQRKCSVLEHMSVISGASTAGWSGRNMILWSKSWMDRTWEMEWFMDRVYSRAGGWLFLGVPACNWHAAFQTGGGFAERADTFFCMFPLISSFSPLNLSWFMQWRYLCALGMPEWTESPRKALCYPTLFVDLGWKAFEGSGREWSSAASPSL